MKIKPKKIQQYSMNKNKIIAKGIAMAIFFAIVSGSVMSQVTADKKDIAINMHRVIIQFSTADTLEHKGLMNNLKNLKEGWGDSVEVEVVVHGPGIDLVTKGKSTQQLAIQEMMQHKVRFVLCQNTMKQRNVSRAQILDGVEFVPMAIGEIILKQEQGWSYLKGGF